MQLVPANVTYRIRLLATGEEVVMSDDVWRYFRALHDMTMDCDVGGALEKGCVVEIPLIEESGVEIDGALLQHMIDFYSVHLVEGYYDTMVEMFSRDRWAHDILTDEEAMIRLVKAADYLHTSELLVFVVDSLYIDMLRQSFAYLEKRAASLTKRKSDGDGDDEKKLRRQYRRELLVRRIMESLLPDNKFVKGIDTRIRKRINPIIISHGNDKTIVLQYGVDSVLIDDPYWSSIATTQESKLALGRARAAVYRHGHNEMVAGVLFYALLDDDGLLTMYSEQPIKERPFGNQPVLAVWAGLQHLFVLGHDALYVFGDGERYQVEGIDASTVLDVSVGAQHALILTRDGLYGWGSNQFNQLGAGNTPPEHGVVLIEYEGRRYFAAEVLCRDDHSVILLSDRKRLIGAGTRSLVERRAMGFNAWDDIDHQWHEIRHQERLPMDGLRGGGDITLMFDGLIFATAMSDEQDVGGFYYYKTLRTGDYVVGVEAQKDNAIIIETKAGLYLTRVQDITLVDRLGGTDSTEEPYKLKLPFGQTLAKKKKEEEGQPPKKKGRFGSCHMCSAKAKLVDMKSTTFFCSRYCFHKALFT